MTELRSPGHTISPISGGDPEDGADAPVSAPSSTRATRAWRDVGAVLAVFVVIGLCAASFVAPHLMRPDVLEDPLRSLLALEQGRSSLFRVTSAEGEAAGWESASLRVVPGISAVASTESPFGDAINSYVDPEGDPSLDDLGRFQLQRAAQGRLRADGTLERSEEISLLGPDGLVLFGYADTGTGAVQFDPPLLLVPRDTDPGETWEQSGTGPGGSTYRLEGRVEDRGALEVPIGSFDDCVTTRIVLAQASADGQTTSDLNLRNSYCAGVGMVAGASSGAASERYELVSAHGIDAEPLALIEPVPTAEDAASETPPDPEGWTLQRAGRVPDVPGAVLYAASAPTFIPGSPPMILVNEQASGDLVAIDAGDNVGNAVWRFRPAAPSYGEPAHDPARGRLYFGASDKRVYALDDRGLFLWTASTGDNVVATPAIAGDLVLAPSEDGTLYALDADTGAEVWTFEVGEAIVASPAVIDDVVVLGADDGVIRGLEVDTGTELWTYEMSGPVQADVVDTGERTVVVAADGGDVAELDARTGEPVWDASVGGDVRFAPAVTDRSVIVIDGDIDLTALARTDGRQRWSARDGAFRGSPVVVGESIVTSGEDGHVRRFDLEGNELLDEDAAPLTLAGDGAPSFRVSPVAGAGGVWFVSDDTTLFRLGDPTGTTTAIDVAWMDPVGTPPLDMKPVVTTPVPWRDRVLLLDAGLGVGSADPADGTGERLGTITPSNGGFPIVEPVVIGDVLVADVGSAHIGVSLPDLTVQWEHPATSDHFATPVVHDGLAIFTEGDDLLAVDIATGDIRWRARAGASPLGTAPLLEDGVLYGGNPVAAWDPDTGSQRWESDVHDPSGTPGASDGHLYVSTSGGAVDDSELSAIDLRTGDTTWQVPVGSDTQTPIGAVHVVGSTIVVDSANLVIGYDVADGTERWRTKMPAASAGTLSIIDGSAYRLLTNSQLLALDPTDGALAASFPGLGLDLQELAIAQRPVLVGDVLVVAAGNAVLGFHPPEAP